MPLSSSPIQSLPRTLLSLLALNLLSSPVQAGFILYGYSTAIPNILTLPVAQTCPVSVDGLTSTNFPWTHNPTCIGQYCVYSSSRFANDRGISLIATPELATSYLLESFSHDDQSDDLQGDTTPDYVAGDTPDKGIGLFARRAIPAGKTIMDKHPVILLPKELADGDRDVTEQRVRLLEIAIRQLPRKTTEMLMGLSTNMGGLRLDDLVRTNAMGVVLGNGGGEGTGYLGVVPEAARINHACRPNAYYRFNDYTLTLSVFTLRPISPSEELTFTYGFSLHPSTLRQSALRTQWGFTCTCALCTSPSSTISASDARITEIAELKRGLPSGHSSIPQLIVLLPSLISLLDEEGIITEVPMYAEILAYAWSALGSEERATKWAVRANEGWKVVAGEDSWEARRTGELRADVEGHPSWKSWDGEKEGFEGSVAEEEERFRERFGYGFDGPEDGGHGHEHEHGGHGHGQGEGHVHEHGHSHSH